MEWPRGSGTVWDSTGPDCLGVHLFPSSSHQGLPVGGVVRRQGGEGGVVAGHRGQDEGLPILPLSTFTARH